MTTDTNKNIILCLTTGRSGTTLLTRLLSLAADICSLHEPEPSFNGVILQLVRSNPDAAVDFVRDHKLPDILARPGHNYAETSHAFGEGFFEAFVSLRIPFRLVILNRDPHLVAKSFWRLNSIPARTTAALRWMLHPEQPGVLHLPQWKRMSDYQLCYWYCLEMERRKSSYAAVCRKSGIPVVEVAIEQLKDWTFFLTMCGELGLTIPTEARTKHAEITARKVHHMSQYWPKLSFVPLRWQEEKVWEALGKEGEELRPIIEARYGATGNIRTI